MSLLDLIRTDQPAVASDRMYGARELSRKEIQCAEEIHWSGLSRRA